MIKIIDNLNNLIYIKIHISNGKLNFHSLKKYFQLQERNVKKKSKMKANSFVECRVPHFKRKFK